MERAELGIDGNAGFALLGDDLQSGEAEFVEIALPPGSQQRPEPLSPQRMGRRREDRRDRCLSEAQRQTGRP